MTANGRNYAKRHISFSNSGILITANSELHWVEYDFSYGR
jgi:uncharacterized FAD-dependent dehydrogenase